MNLISTNFEFFVQHDINPFVIFDAKGKIKYTNVSADLILTPSASKTIHQLALTYAPHSYGSSKTMIDVSIGAYEFYCVNVIYQNESELGIYLYHKPQVREENTKLFDKFHKTNINLLLKAHIELFKLSSNASIKLLVDLDIPEFFTHQNDLAILLKKIFDKFKNLKTINISIKIKMSEKILIDTKKYNIVALSFSSDCVLDKEENKEIIKIANKNYINVYLSDNAIVLELPIVE